MKKALVVLGGIGFATLLAGYLLVWRPLKIGGTQLRTYGSLQVYYGALTGLAAFFLEVGRGWILGLATDEELIGKFDAHVAEFNSLSRSIAADHSFIYTPECKRRLAAIGVTSAIGAPGWEGGYEVCFWMSATGWVVHSTYKGILWSDAEVRPLVDSLDAVEIPLQTTAYRRIADHWYVCVQRD